MSGWSVGVSPWRTWLGHRKYIVWASKEWPMAPYPHLSVRATAKASKFPRGRLDCEPLGARAMFAPMLPNAAGKERRSLTC